MQYYLLPMLSMWHCIYPVWDFVFWKRYVKHSFSSDSILTTESIQSFIGFVIIFVILLYLLRHILVLELRSMQGLPRKTNRLNWYLSPQKEHQALQWFLLIWHHCGFAPWPYHGMIFDTSSYTISRPLFPGSYYHRLCEGVALNSYLW